MYVCVCWHFEKLLASVMLKTQSVKPGQWQRAWKKKTKKLEAAPSPTLFFLPLGACFSCVADSDVTGSATTSRQTTKSEERRYRINIRFISAAAFKHSRRQNKTKQNRAGGSWETFYKRTVKGKCLMSAAREVLSQQGGRQLTAAVKGTCLQSIRQTPPP